MAVDIKKIIQDTVMETANKVTQDLGVLMEDVQSDVKQILETVETHTRQLERLEPIEVTLDQLKTDVDAVKTTLEQVSIVELKQELSDLKKRVEELETKTR